MQQSQESAPARHNRKFKVVNFGNASDSVWKSDWLWFNAFWYRKRRAERRKHR